jgi:RNA-directed DNA polymerase
VARSHPRSEKSAEAIVAVRGEGPNVRKDESSTRLDEAMVQKSIQLELPFEGRGEAPRAERSGQASSASCADEHPGTGSLMELVVERDNLKRALKRVKRNKGSPGVDGMDLDELSDYLRQEWPHIREELLVGCYEPLPVLRQLIDKPGGGKRELGIPTVLDRFIQQAILQVLQPIYDVTFSDHSHGFRPGRGAHDAIREAQRYIQGGKQWVVDVDVEKFFDRVNHDVLMGRLARKISDRRLLRLIRRYLVAGVMDGGVVVERHEGTPQGGPLSPLLANVLLDDVDKELEGRGHAFVRYADDLRVFVGSQRAGERVMRSLVTLFGKLRLQINKTKSAVDRALNRSFLGFSFWKPWDSPVRLAVSCQSLSRMKDRVRQITSRSGGRSIVQVAKELRQYLLGWRGYFRLADTPNIFRRLDGWIRHRLRAIHLKHWKRGRTAYRELRARGVSSWLAQKVAAGARCWWRTSAESLNTALPNTYFDELGVPRLAL